MKSLILALFLTTPLFQSKAFAINDATLTLHKYLLSIEFNATETDIDVVKKLVHSGADINALGPTGGNALSVMVETWANMSRSAKQEELQRAYEIVNYLIDTGANVQNIDYRGFNVLYAILRYGATSPMAYDLIHKLLEKKPNINYLFQEADNYNGFGLIHLLSRGRQDKILFELLDQGLRLTPITKHGLHFGIQAATVPPNQNGLLLKNLMDRLSPTERNYFATRAYDDGTTPLHAAVWRGNLPAVQYLVDNYPVDINALDNNGDTPLSAAYYTGKKEVYDYLQSKGARLPTVDLNLYCHKANQFRLTYDQLVRIIKTCKVKSVDQLLPLLPVRYRSNYTLAYANLAVQSASPDYPQAILYGDDAQLVTTFNGHRSQRGYNSLEVIHFDNKSKTFELRDIEFPENGFGEAKISEPNPNRCITCHGQVPRPLWDNWTFWPGKFNSQMEQIFPTENQYFYRYQHNRYYGRYKHLPPVSITPILGTFGRIPMMFSQNTKLDVLFNGLMAQMSTREISSNPLLKPYRYALLGALSCTDPIEDYIPREKTKSFALSYSYLLRDTSYQSAAEADNRLKLEASVNLLQGRYILQESLHSVRYDDHAGRNFDVARITRLRYIMENLKINMQHWFTHFNFNQPSYSPLLPFSDFENILWYEVLNPSTDQQLYAAFYEEARKQDDLRSNLFYKKNAIGLCSELRKKSLAALSTL